MRCLLTPLAALALAVAATPGRAEGVVPPARERFRGTQAQVEPDRAAPERVCSGGNIVVHRQYNVADQRSVRVEPGIEVVSDQNSRPDGNRGTA